ncbi:hypothetical protein MKW94_015137, partial [Papaver nudicaule]|nr:hypothetical protein [Papaver nudicaule]
MCMTRVNSKISIELQHPLILLSHHSMDITRLQIPMMLQGNLLWCPCCNHFLSFVPKHLLQNHLRKEMALRYQVINSIRPDAIA